MFLQQIVKTWQTGDVQPCDLADALAAIRDARGLTQNDLKDLKILLRRERSGAPVHRRRFQTSHATITITFHKREVSTEDILAALDEVQLRVRAPDADSQRDWPE